MPKERRERLDESMWHEEDRGHETPCWIWNGKPHARTGYCRVKFEGRVVLAHRAMHEQEVGPIPDGYDVDHLCSQRDCVRHTEAVTRAVNVQRSRASKLTPADVRAIRDSSLSMRAAGRAWGIHHSTVSSIRSGHAWAGV